MDEVFFKADLGQMDPLAMGRPIDIAWRDLGLGHKGHTAIAEIGELRREEMRAYEEEKKALREASVIDMMVKARDEEPAEVVTIDTGKGGRQKFHVAPDTTKVASPRAGGGGCPGCGVCGACSAEGRERIRKRFAAANLAYEAAQNADEDAPERAPKRARTK